MKPLIVGEVSVAAQAAVVTKRRERLFYTGMAVAVVITVFAGFARTYFLRPYFDARPLLPLLHLQVPSSNRATLARAHPWPKCRWAK